MHSFYVQPERIVDIAIKAESKKITGEFSFSLLCASLNFSKNLCHNLSFLVFLSLG